MKKTLTLISLLIMLSALFVSCEKEPELNALDTLKNTDILSSVEIVEATGLNEEMTHYFLEISFDEEGNISLVSGGTTEMKSKSVDGLKLNTSFLFTPAYESSVEHEADLTFEVLGENKVKVTGTVKNEDYAVTLSGIVPLMNAIPESYSDYEWLRVLDSGNARITEIGSPYFIFPVEFTGIEPIHLKAKQELFKDGDSLVFSIDAKEEGPDWYDRAGEINRATPISEYEIALEVTKFIEEYKEGVTDRTVSNTKYYRVARLDSIPAWAKEISYIEPGISVTLPVSNESIKMLIEIGKYSLASRIRNADDSLTMIYYSEGANETENKHCVTIKANEDPDTVTMIEKMYQVDSSGKETLFTDREMKDVPIRKGSIID